MAKENSVNDAEDKGNGLLPGEKIRLKDPDSDSTATDEELNRKYVKGEIRIVSETARYSLAGILAMLQEEVTADESGKKEKRYKLDPEYQRRHRWSIGRKSRLIESFLMNVPVPPVFLYERDLARFEVMDGRQRLTALSEFYADQFALEGLQFWTELHGRTYSTLPGKVKDGIDRRYISSVILLQETAQSKEQAAQLKKMVFERLNAGGVKLSSQETRNAVYDGPLNQLCMELSENHLFRTMWGLPLSLEFEEETDFDEDVEEPGEAPQATQKGKSMYEEMGDVELVLRFFAYRQIKSWPSGLNRINEFLDRFLIEGNKFRKAILSEYKEMFESTISFVFEMFGKEAFHRVSKAGKPSGGPTKIVFDPIMYVASKYSRGPDRDTLSSRKDTLVEKINEIKQNDIFGGRKTNSADTALRNRRVMEIFQAVLKI